MKSVEAQFFSTQEVPAELISQVHHRVSLLWVRQYLSWSILGSTPTPKTPWIV